MTRRLFSKSRRKKRLATHNFFWKTYSRTGTTFDALENGGHLTLVWGMEVWSNWQRGADTHFFIIYHEQTVANSFGWIKLRSPMPQKEMRKRQI